MELELEAGGRTNRVVPLSGDTETAELGRGDLGPAEAPPADRTVSRRHVSLRLLGGGDHRVTFEVVGRNPVVVRSADGNRVYRRGEAGELRAGDGLSLSLKAPSFWAVRRTNGDGEGEVDAAVLDAVARRERRTRERKERERRAVEEAMEVTDEEAAAAACSGALDAEVEVEDLKFDVASIDPVREFGFLSMGHEFDNYQRGRICPPKDWNWFLEEIRRSSDDEDDEVSNEGGKSKGGRGANKKKKEGEGEGEDEAWAGESEDEKDSLSSGPNAKRPKYVTRSKDPKKPRKENSKVKKENKDDEDSEDETLGGFIVNEEDEHMEDLSGEEEEEEFDDEDDDD